ncbi:hypothetical protein PHJA_001586900 [Phtheirospermum japonicum]|uniref:Uncharacterized protein n=1 Tax=Phtheirospermum japonicum TaxID=374723 RepID=A0A830CGZ2_9LAMI|nr:hypothetical protein PHJA_001586900 [Phtheirospermum japonicum]
MLAILVHTETWSLDTWLLFFAISKPGKQKINVIRDFFDRSIKALDVCNTIRDGIEQIRQWQKLLEIIMCAFDYKIRIIIKGALAKGNFRNRSFGRHQKESSTRSLGHFRSLSWSMSRSWSAARKLQAISNNLVGPRPNEMISTSGLNVVVFTMNYVLFFVMWALVAAIPCQDRGLQRILEESKSRDRRNACGLLRETREVERCVRIMNELRVKEGLDPLERLVRDVFRRIVRNRTDGLDSIARVT